MSHTTKALAPAHPTWEGKTDAWKFVDQAFLAQTVRLYAEEKGIHDLATTLLLSDFSLHLHTVLEQGIKSIMSPVSGLHVNNPTTADIEAGDAVMKLLGDVRNLWNELGAPGTYVGSTTPMTDTEHKELHSRMIDNTRESQGEALAEASPMHGVYIQNTSSAICITGNTPQAQRRATLISMLLSALPGIFVMIKMAEAKLKDEDLDAEARAILATVAPDEAT